MCRAPSSSIKRVSAERDFRSTNSWGLAQQVRNSLQCRSSSQKEKGMDSSELLVYAVIGVLGTLGVEAVIGYKVAVYLDKKHGTD